MVISIFSLLISLVESSEMTQCFLKHLEKNNKKESLRKCASSSEGFKYCFAVSQKIFPPLGNIDLCSRANTNFKRCFIFAKDIVSEKQSLELCATQAGDAKSIISCFSSARKFFDNILSLRLCIGAQKKFSDCFRILSDYIGSSASLGICSKASTEFSYCFLNAIKYFDINSAAKFCIGAEVGFKKCIEERGSSFAIKSEFFSCLNLNSGFIDCVQEFSLSQDKNNCEKAKAGFKGCVGIIQSHKLGIPLEKCLNASRAFDFCFKEMGDELSPIEAVKFCLLLD